MAGPAFPSYAYNATQPAQVVASQAAFTALGAGWAFTPFVTPPLSNIAPADPGFTDTDIRLQQMLVELRVLNAKFYEANPGGDPPDSTGLRADILATDSGLST